MTKTSMGKWVVITTDYGLGDGYGSGKSDSTWAVEAVELEHDQEKLTNWYLKETNAEKVVDSKNLEVGGYYELYECELHGQKRKLLKMTNPSTGIFHMEWVPIDINSVVEALKWRNYGYLPDDIS